MVVRSWRGSVACRRCEKGLLCDTHSCQQDASNMSWLKLGVHPDIVKALGPDELDWLLPNDVQDEAIPFILVSHSVHESSKLWFFAIPFLFRAKVTFVLSI